MRDHADFLKKIKKINTKMLVHVNQINKIINPMKFLKINKQTNK